jgi:hypothetical protein
MRLVLIKAKSSGDWKAIACLQVDIGTLMVMHPGRPYGGSNEMRVVTLESAREDYGVQALATRRGMR